MAKRKPKNAEPLAAERHKPTGLGKLLCNFRNGVGMSIRDIADATRLSRSYLGELEAGLKNPSPEALEKIGQALALSEFDLELLRSAATNADEELVSPMFMVRVGNLIRREMAGDLAEVWVVSRHPLELLSPDQGGVAVASNQDVLSAVVSNLNQDCKICLLRDWWGCLAEPSC